MITKVKDEIDNLSPNKVFAVVHISEWHTHTHTHTHTNRNNKHVHIYVVWYNSGGHQFKITQNDLIVINRIEADIGEKIFLEKVSVFSIYPLMCSSV